MNRCFSKTVIIEMQEAFMAQTKRELVKAALDCKPVDRVPVGFWHHFWQIRDTQMHWPITPLGG